MFRHRRLLWPTILLLLTFLITSCGNTPPAIPQSGASGTTTTTSDIPAVGATSPAATAEGGAPSATTASGTSTQTAFDPTGAGLVVYSGRNQNLVGSLIDKFQAETGIKVAVRYGDTGELAGAILEEGDNSPADLFFAQDAGALGALAQAERLDPLPVTVLDKVEPRFRSTTGLWVGVSGRARVVAYNTANVQPTDLPASIRDFTDPRFKGKIGWVPTNASFQSFVTALRKIDGDEKALAWLQGMLANEPKVYTGNAAAVEAVAAGEVDYAFVNHYYLYNLQKQKGGEVGAANYFFPSGDPGSLVNVAGVGIVKGTAASAAATRFVEYLLSEEAQRYFATETFEYPLVNGITADNRLTPLSQIQTPTLDLSDLEDLEGTQELLRTAGVL